MTGKLRMGVAGVGSLGFHHARILRDVEGVTMAGFFEPDGDRARDVARELGILSHPTLEALLDSVDALVVAAPTTFHRQIAEAALGRGIHTFIEKPIASSLGEADAILEAARATGAVVQTGHVERFNAAVLAAEPYLDQPLFIESHRLAPFVNRGTDVAVILDLMIHDVDLVQALVGTPIEGIAATGVPVLTSSVDIANARLDFRGGAVANLTASRVSLERMRKLRIFQRSGYLSLNLADGTGRFLRLRGSLPALGGDAAGTSLAELAAAGGLADIVETIPLAGEKVEPLRRELESFRDAALGIRAPVVSGWDGREALAVALSIQSLIEKHVADSRTA